jgi:hypothetical protein
MYFKRIKAKRQTVPEMKHNYIFSKFLYLCPTYFMIYNEMKPGDRETVFFSYNLFKNKSVINYKEEFH